MDRFNNSINQRLKKLTNEGALAIMGGSFFMKVASFLGSIVLVRLIAKSEYGTLAHIENIYTYGVTFAGLGLNWAVFRYVVLASNNEEKKGIVKFSLLRGQLINIAICILIIIVVLLDNASSSNNAKYLLPIMMIALPFQYSFETGQFTLRALFRNKEYALFAVCATALVWMTKIIGAKVFGVTGAVIGWPIAYFISSLVVLLYINNKVLLTNNYIEPNRDTIREMHIYSIQYMITNGMWSLFFQNDLLMINQITNNSLLVADYKVAYAIPAAISILSSSIGIFAAPYFVKKESDRTWIWENYKSVLLGTFLIVLCASGIIVVGKNIVVKYMYGEEYLNIIPLLMLLLVSSIINNGLRYPTANLFASMGIIRVNMAIAGIGMVLQVSCNYILIPIYGVYGAAITSIIAYSFMAISVNYAFIKRFRYVKSRKDNRIE